MNTDSTLLQRLKNTKTKELTKTEKHRCAKVEDAYDHELIKQSKNRAMLGKFLVFFVMGIFLTLGLLFIFMIFLYGRGLVGDCFKLETTILSWYEEIKTFFSNYQALIAALVTLAVGDKMKSAKEK